MQREDTGGTNKGCVLTGCEKTQGRSERMKFQTPMETCFGGWWPPRSCRRISQIAPLLLCHNHDNSPRAPRSHYWTFTENIRFSSVTHQLKAPSIQHPPLPPVLPPLQNGVMKITESCARQLVAGGWKFCFISATPLFCREMQFQKNDPPFVREQRPSVHSSHFSNSVSAAETLRMYVSSLQPRCCDMTPRGPADIAGLHKRRPDCE